MTQDDTETKQPRTTGKVHVHTEIGNREGVIVELRREGWDFPNEGDMSHLSDEQARELRDALDEYFRENGEAEIDCPYCEGGEMYRDGSKVVCDDCGQVKLA